jgi:transcriptional regulator with XRE-family HTH domain
MRLLRRKELQHVLIDDGRQQRVIADLCDMSEHGFSDIVRGATARPRPETRRRIAEVLGVPERQIFPDFAEGDDTASLTTID